MSSGNTFVVLSGIFENVYLFKQQDKVILGWLSCGSCYLHVVTSLILNLTDDQFKLVHWTEPDWQEEKSGFVRYERNSQQFYSLTQTHNGRSVLGSSLIDIPFIWVKIV